MALNSSRVLVLCGVVGFALAGCGQRGPLTLPDETDATDTAAASNTAVTEDPERNAADGDEDESGGGR